MDNKSDDLVKGNRMGFAQQGWQCPVCLRVNAPWVSQCPCNPCGYLNYPTYPTYPPTDRPEFPQWPTVTCCVGSKDCLCAPEKFHE